MLRVRGSGEERRPTRVVEATCVLLAALLLPILLRGVPASATSFLGWLHLKNLVDPLVGKEVSTDVAALVAQAQALITPGESAYSPLGELYREIGVDWPVSHSNMHMPFEIPLFLVLVPIPVGWWTSFWISGSFVMIAWAMRLMGIRPIPAYAVTVAAVITVPGSLALRSTYPLLALLLALTWRWRQSSALAGVCLAIISSGRAAGGVVAGWFLMARRYRPLVWATFVVALLGLTVLVLDAQSFSDFFSLGREGLHEVLRRDDNLTVQAVLVRLGLQSEFSVAIGLLPVAVVARWRRHDYWAWVWASMASAPIAWSYSVVQGVPLLANCWSRGRIGRGAVVTTALAVLATPSHYGLAWPLFVVASGFGVLKGARSQKSSG